jgi:hypothetical protein
VQTVKKLSNQRSDKGSRIYRSETNGFDSRKANLYNSIVSYVDVKINKKTALSKNVAKGTKATICRVQNK